MRIHTQKSSKTKTSTYYQSITDPLTNSKLPRFLVHTDQNYPLSIKGFTEATNSTRFDDVMFQIFLSKEECKRLQQAIEIMLSDSAYLERNNLNKKEVENVGI